MAGKISGFFREFSLFFSIVLTIIGLLLFIIGITANMDINLLNLSEDILNWSLYILILGFFVLIAGIWYLYSFFHNRKFIIEELATNKRSELIKKHSELKQTAKKLPSKYQKMLREKEKEYKIR